MAVIHGAASTTRTVATPRQTMAKVKSFWVYA
jgi:hypothetical protein